jgi:hypothetical protein
MTTPITSAQAAQRAEAPARAKAKANQAKQKAARENAAVRLNDIGREIKARVGKLNQLGGKAVDQVDSINHLLGEAEKLCDPAGFTFAAFKKSHCPELGQSRIYELLAIRDGRKTLEEIRADTRKRVAKHREGKRDVTENSVTSPEVSAKARKAPRRATEGEEVSAKSASEDASETAKAKKSGTKSEPEPARPRGAGSAETEITDEAAKARFDEETPTPAEPPTNGTNKPDALAEKLRRLLHEAWELCQDHIEWPLNVSSEQRAQAMAELRDLSNRLVKLATPMSAD